jgi:RimJ/RimL family protein N-acetyltransferase
MSGRERLAGREIRDTGRCLDSAGPAGCHDDRTRNAGSHDRFDQILDVFHALGCGVSPDWPLETSRLTLRPFVEADLDAVHAMRSDPDVVRFLYGEVQSREETRKSLAQKIASPRWVREGDWFSAAAVERESALIVGDMAFHWVSERDRTAEIGFVFDSRHQRKGFATEASRALIGWVFDDAGFHRVIGRAEARNAASARVLEKLGMRLEAHFVENEWVKDEWQSELLYAILEREWTG